MSGGNDVEKARRKLPHWRQDGATYFITFALREGKFSLAERSIVLRHIRMGDSAYHSLVAATVMEDHVHVILTPKAGISLDRITKGIKGASARAINSARGTRGALWLVESEDRIVRNEKELCQKLRYLLNNAPKKGLAEDGWEYTWWHFNEDAIVLGGIEDGAVGSQ